MIEINLKKDQVLKQLQSENSTLKEKIHSLNKMRMDMNEQESTIQQLEQDNQSLKNKLHKWEQKASSNESIEFER